MRRMTLKNSAEFQALSARLNVTPSQRTEALKLLRALNPNVKFDEFNSDTVILLPDVPAFRNEMATSVAADAFTELRNEVLSSLAGVDALRAAQNAEMVVDHEALRVVLKSELLQRTSEAEPALKAAMATAVDQLNVFEKSVVESEGTRKAFRAEVAEELDTLVRLFR